MMVAADLLHEECDAQIGAFTSQRPDPRWLHGPRTTAGLAAADDPVPERFHPVDAATWSTRQALVRKRRI
jgi:hypothetical protein